MVAGPAGSGKTTLGQALALRVRARHLDLDDVTADLVAEFLAAHPDLDHASAFRELRTRRYRELAAQARESLAARPLDDLVLIAPFTAEISSDDLWRAWLADVDTAPDRAHLVWLSVSPQERLRRMAVRAAARDVSTLAAAEGGDGLPRLDPPAVPCLILDALLPIPTQVDSVLQHFGNASATV